MKPEHLLVEVETLIRTAPPWTAFINESNSTLVWRGQAAAVSRAIDQGTELRFRVAETKLDSSLLAKSGYQALMALLHEMRHTLRMNTIGPVSEAIGHGHVFQYFDEIRQLIESANVDILFVDPYLDAEFVSRYLGNVKTGVTVRLLGNKMTTLIPAVEAFAKEHGTAIEIRKSDAIHDRFMIVDKKTCYQSGASFKDGAKNAPTTLTQITDTFAAVRDQYELIWSNSVVRWPSQP
jgi:hypothetical protein